MHFTIYRDNWRWGGVLNADQGITGLFNEGRQCCVGQIASQCGVELKALKPNGHLHALPKPYLAKLHEMGFLRLTTDPIRPLIEVSKMQRMYQVNDDETIMASGYREHRLIELVKGLGHTMEFQDGKAPWLEGVSGVDAVVRRDSGVVVSELAKGPGLTYVGAELSCPSSGSYFSVSAVQFHLGPPRKTEEDWNPLTDTPPGWTGDSPAPAPNEAPVEEPVPA